MLGDELDSPDEVTAADVAARYESALVDVVSAVGPDRTAAEADVDAAVVESIEAGEADTVELADAATILALDSDRPDAEAIVSAARDRLLLLMTGAMLDVETVAREFDDDTEPGELQAKIEGRFPVSIGEYARLHHYLARRAAR